MKERLKLNDLKIKSFLTRGEVVNGGGNNSNTAWRDCVTDFGLSRCCE